MRRRDIDSKKEPHTKMWGTEKMMICLGKMRISSARMKLFIQLNSGNMCTSSI